MFLKINAWSFACINVFNFNFRPTFIYRKKLWEVLFKRKYVEIFALLFMFLPENHNACILWGKKQKMNHTMYERTEAQSNMQSV